ncbi:hypothetical protein K7X08_010911 [Anisodus acutangulus]|uniref:Uncharacterized protein n=1 Tax=Anisodus acutangulus TaxID=402998 RepID=A0A9Q1RBD4_9SOLA|nr:hypothetical protein K7X08_010911 [Anisodus acutangulus]
MGQSSRGDVESTNVNMKKELESFLVHVDLKFAKILQAIVDLNKKVDAKVCRMRRRMHFLTFAGCIRMEIKVHGGNENMKDVTPNDSVGGGDSSKKAIGGSVGDRVGSGVGVGEGNDSQSDFVCFFVVTEQAREDMLPQGGDADSTDVGNEYVDGGLAKWSESVLAPPPENVARP